MQLPSQPPQGFRRRGSQWLFAQDGFSASRQATLISACVAVRRCDDHASTRSEAIRDRGSEKTVAPAAAACARAASASNTPTRCAPGIPRPRRLACSEPITPVPMSPRRHSFYRSFRLPRSNVLRAPSIRSQSPSWAIAASRAQRRAAIMHMLRSMRFIERFHSQPTPSRASVPCGQSCAIFSGGLLFGSCSASTTNQPS